MEQGINNNQCKDLKMDLAINKILTIAKKISQRALACTTQLFQIVNLQENGLATNFAALIATRKQILFPWTYEVKNHIQSPICSKRIYDCETQICFSCLDCQQSTSSILCYECFSQSNHEGHRFICMRTTGGICDCGDRDSWSQKGFCKRHGNRSQNIEIDQKLQEIFVPEMSLAFYLYFWLVEQKKRGQKVQNIQKQYGLLLLELSANLVSKQYQLKYLLSQVMQSKFKGFPQLPNIDLTLIQCFFRLEDTSQLSYFNKIAAELFTVEKFQQTFIRQFFIKTFNNGMFKTHPLRQLFYQYMNQVNTILHLISKEVISPYLLNKQKVIATNKQVQILFKTYIIHLQILSKMKSSPQYYKIHFQRVNICDMFFYRNYSKKQGDQYSINIDELYVKFIGDIIVMIANQRPILQKIITNLLQFIKQTKRQAFSLIHQRVFAMTLIAYLEGDLRKLSDTNIIQIFFNPKQQQDCNKFIEDEIVQYLSMKIKSDRIVKQNEGEQNESFVLQNHPQRFILQSLDTVYIKILMKCYKGDLDFQKIVDLAVSISPNLVIPLMNIITSVITMQIDELIVANCVNVLNQQKYNHFLKRLIRNYPSIKALQFKQIVSLIIHNQKFMESFLVEEVKVEKGKIIQKFQQKPLQSFIYYSFFKREKVDFFKSKVFFFQSLPKTQSNLNIKIYTEKVKQQIFQQIEKIKTIVALFCQIDVMGLISIKNLVQYALIQLAKIYSQTKDTRAQVVYKQMLECIEVMSPYLQRQAIEQANLIFYPKKQEVLHKQQVQNLEIKKKQALSKKRKEKEDIMKKKQSDLLKQYQNIQQNELMQVCIYCKQNNNIPLYFVAFMSLTNIYQKKCLKIVNQHIFFKTCGHKIHHQCYNKYLNQTQQLNACFLCKAHINILIPSFEKECKEHNSLSMEFKTLVYPTLLKIHNDEDIIQQFYNSKHNGDIISILLESFIRQVIFQVIFALDGFQKDVFPIYSTIFNILQLEEGQQIFEKLEQMKKMLRSVKNSIFKDIEIVVITLFQAIFSKRQSSSQQEKREINEYIYNILAKMVRLFSQGKGQQEIIFQKNVKILQEQIIRNLPQKMTDLLPLKPFCKLCKGITNRLFSCLLCDWIGCQQDNNCMRNHTQKQHLDGSIFIFLLNGQIIYVFMGEQNVKESIYYNFLGEGLNNKNWKDKDKLSQFCLDRAQYEKLQKNVISHSMNRQANLK